MRQVILYFGSFNPVHKGHIALAEAVAARFEAQVWFVLSPQNPFKQNDDLWREEIRAHLLKKSLENRPALRFCDVELHLPKPSYTIHTLDYLHKQHPDTEFSILMGEDNLAGLPKWKAIDQIMAQCRILVYPRQNASVAPTMPDNPRIELLRDLPLWDVSSTEIRRKMAKNEDVSALVPWQADELRNLRLS